MNIYIYINIIYIYNKIYLIIRGGSRKNIAKKIIPNVPTNKKV